MVHGLDPSIQPLMRWNWLPMAPPPPEARLEAKALRMAGEFGEIVPRKGEWEAFRGGFAQLAEVTPDLRLYRLVQVFNTPLKSMSAKDAGKAQYGYWDGTKPPGAAPGKWCHLWFYEDRKLGGHWIVEFTFDHGLSLKSFKGTQQEVKGRYLEVCALVQKPPIPV